MSMYSACQKYNLRNPVIFIDTEASGAPGGTGRADRLSRQVRTDVVKAFVMTAKTPATEPEVCKFIFFLGII